MKTILILLLSFTLPAFADPITESKPSDWRPVAQENMLYMKVAGKELIIELNADFAPASVANVKALAKEKYWDGLAVVRVQDGYVVQWADPEEMPEKKRKFKEAKEKVPYELDVTLNPKTPFTKLPDHDVYAAETGFSSGFAAARDPKAKRMWLSHCYGAVGVGRDVAPDSGNGSELYVVIGHSPRHLDRNVTVIGKVIKGIETLAVLPRGRGKLGFYEKPEMHVKIESIRLGTDVPEKERAKLEVMDTNSTQFKKWIEARRNRTEEWFHHKVGRVELCNVPVPVRDRVSTASE
jgi:cyclophilin family peptidyl-prolyl cis-trans isomerase